MYSPPTTDGHGLHVSVARCYFVDLHSITNASAPASTAWPTANLAMYVLILIRTQVTAKQIFLLNGATVSGSFDLGIYDDVGNRLYNTGSQTQLGASLPQAVTIANGLILPRGRYYIGLALDNTTATVQRWTGGTGIGGLPPYLGMGQQTGAFPLPATATFAATTNNLVPSVGLILGTQQV